MKQTIDSFFPKLQNGNYRITSPPSKEYNCIAWAFEDTERWWWPDKNKQYFWPDRIKREETIEAFIDAFEANGFVICDNAKYEYGYIKIAVFVDNNNTPTHASRQLLNGKWTSKLGAHNDIEHNLLDISGINIAEYGNIGIIMKKEL